MAKAGKILCDELNIWCSIALSEANPDKGIKYRHAWNVIQINGQYYHLDATFDNTLSRDDTVRYDYVKFDIVPQAVEIEKCFTNQFVEMANDWDRAVVEADAAEYVFQQQ